MAPAVAQIITLPGLKRDSQLIRTHVLVIQRGQMTQHTQAGPAGAPLIPAAVTGGLSLGSILVISSNTGSPFGQPISHGPVHLIIYKEPQTLPPGTAPQWTSISTFCRSLLPRMLSHRSGHRLFDADALGKLDFWNLVRERGMLGAGEKSGLNWLVSSCRLKYFDDCEISHRLSVEDLLEYLCRDTFAFELAV